MFSGMLTSPVKTTTKRSPFTMAALTATRLSGFWIVKCSFFASSSTLCLPVASDAVVITAVAPMPLAIVLANSFAPP